MREQSGSTKWKLERANRLTASQFGQVFKRKAAVTEKFLKERFEGKTIQTPAMKYGLTNSGADDVQIWGRIVHFLLKAPNFQELQN